jgi:hypothetical protein
MMKKYLRLFGLTTYVAILAFLILAVIKPGTAFFFRKISPSSENFEIDSNRIDFPIQINSNFYDFKSILIREEGQILTRVKVEELPEMVKGVFAVENIGGNDLIIRIIPANPKEANQFSDFMLLVRPRIITASWIPYLLAFLSAGIMFAFLSLTCKSSFWKKKQFRLRSFWNRLDQPLKIKSFLQTRRKWLLQNTLYGIFISFVYVFFEWIFFITKLSFMSVLSTQSKLGVLFITGFFVLLLLLISLFLISSLDFLFSVLSFGYSRFIYFIPSGFILASLILILFDNFTYTVFKFGIVSSSGAFRVFYLFGFTFIFIEILRSISKWGMTRKQKNLQIMLGIVAGIIVLGYIGCLIAFYSPISSQDENKNNADSLQTPNIILLSDDGLDAANMSLYGYERQTTPFLDSLAESSLLMMNNFTNANSSTGSDTAMLTGKLPFDTRVLYPPNTLEGMDSLEHLPGILNNLGYYTLSLGVPHFVDVSVINFQNGFDSVNCAEDKSSDLSERFSRLGYFDSVYFFTTIKERLVDRLLHVSLIRKMENPYLLVKDVENASRYYSSNKIKNCLESRLLNSNAINQPIFAHIHMISTHGPRFDPEMQLFSNGEEQDNNWMVDFYDDAILNFDYWVNDFVEFLKQENLYQNTILVFYTDHGSGWTVNKRIPLMIHFPDESYSGEIIANTQNMDIAPTILAYMGIDQPYWMTGESLLSTLQRNRLIYSAEFNSSLIERGNIIEANIKPPFFQFKFINVIQCQDIYTIDLTTGIMTEATVPDYYDPCDEAILDSPEVIRDSALKLLSGFGYEIPNDW